jgi:hypothetical protein
MQIQKQGFALKIIFWLDIGDAKKDEGISFRIHHSQTVFSLKLGQ